METTTVHSVGELLSNLEKMQYQFAQSYRGSGFIFRGERSNSWSMLPSFFRKYDKPQKSTVVVDASYSGRVYSASENEMIAHFKKEAGGFVPNISQDDEFTWLQYAQHFGMPTRLLDFTANPLIALFFCCKAETKEDGALWVINASPFQTWSQDEQFCHQLGADCTRDAMISSIMKGIKGYSDNDEERLEKQRPVLFVPAYIDQRMSAQSSRFLLWGKIEKSLEEMIDENNLMSPFPDGVTYRIANDQRFLRKINIVGESKHSIMRELNLLGVNEKTVFPGLDGIGRYLEQYYKENVDDISLFI